LSKRGTVWKASKGNTLTADRKGALICAMFR
jgi:hypothetical protein